MQPLHHAAPPGGQMGIFFCQKGFAKAPLAEGLEQTIAVVEQRLGHGNLTKW